MLALVTGATGFVGRRVVKELRAKGFQVRCLVHTPGREQAIRDGQVEFCHGSVQNLSSIKSALFQVDVVVHLVAIIRERGGATFELINHRGTENVATAARELAVKHFINMSALGVQNNPRYPYLYSKWLGEQAVIKSGIPYTIFKPSLQFGEGDELINTLAGLVRALPIIPIAGSGRNQFQPIAVDDVAQCVAASVMNEALMGKTLEIGGPEYLTYDEIVDIIAQTYGVKRAKLHIPVPIMRLMIRFMETLLPRPPATTEQLRMMSVPNIAQLNTVEEVFGFKPKPLRGNIEFIKKISYRDGLKIAFGLMPTHIRDH